MVDIVRLPRNMLHIILLSISQLIIARDLLRMRNLLICSSNMVLNLIRRPRRAERVVRAGRRDRCLTGRLSLGRDRRDVRLQRVLRA